MNISEGSGKGTAGDRRGYFEIARGSAFEGAAIQDVLEVCKTLTSGQNQEGKEFFDRIAAMLTQLGERTFTVHQPDQRYQGHAHLLHSTASR